MIRHRAVGDVGKIETEAQERSGMCVILETNSYSSVFEDKGSDPGE